SMMSALVCRSTILAASTTLSVHPAKICRLRGFSRSSTYSIFRVRSLPCRIALSLTISAQTRPTPNSLAIRRKAGLQTPAIGASTTLFFVSTGPIFSFFITAPHPPFYIAFFKPIYSSSHHRIRRSDAIRGPSHARPVRGLFDPLPDRRPAPGNPQIARHFQEGNQDEGPLLHPGMGNGQFLPVKNAVPVQQDVDVQGAGSPADGPHPVKPPLDLLGDRKKLLRRKGGVGGGDQVEKIRLLHRTDGGRLIDGGDPGDADGRMGLEQLQPLAQVGQPVAQIGAQPQVGGHRLPHGRLLRISTPTES